MQLDASQCHSAETTSQCYAIQHYSYTTTNPASSMADCSNATQANAYLPNVLDDTQ